MTINPVAMVFDIPLLQDAISTYLVPRDLRRCVCVSQTWCSIFKPYLYRIIIVNSRTTSIKLKSISLQDLLTRNAHRIKVIDCGILDWPFPENLPLGNLTVLKSPYSRSKAVSMVHALPKLRDLEFFPIGSSSDCLSSMLSAIASHNHLRRIKFTYASSLNSAELAWILWSFARLESITLSVAYYDHNSAASIGDLRILDNILATAPSCPAVKDLNLESVVLNLDHTVLKTFLLKCRHLKSLSLPIIIKRASTPDYRAIFTASEARIQRLDAQRAWLSGPDMAAIIQACVGLRWFRGSREQRDVRGVVDALLKHSETLEDVDLTDTGTDDLTGSMLQSVLCGCPHLRSFVAMMPLSKYHPNIDRHMDPVLCAIGMAMSDGSQGLDWACVNLTKLAIRFMPNVDILLNRMMTDDVEEGSAMHIPVIPRVLVNQLKRLSMLEDLRLGRMARATVWRCEDAVESNRQHIEDAGFMAEGMLTISEAVATLATLERMKRLELRNLMRFIDHEAIQGMRATHWRHMEWCQYS